MEDIYLLSRSVRRSLVLLACSITILLTQEQFQGHPTKGRVANGKWHGFVMQALTLRRPLCLQGSQRQVYLDEGMSNEPVVVVWHSRDAVVEAVRRDSPIFPGSRQSTVNITGHRRQRRAPLEVYKALA